MDWIYLTFFPIAVAVALSSHVLTQNPRGRSNRIFALYALSHAIASHATLAMTTTDSPLMAQVTATVLTIFMLSLNGALLLSLILGLYYRRHLARGYGAPLIIGLGVLLSAAIAVDSATKAGLILAMPTTLGQGYVPLGDYLHGPWSPLLWGWLGATSLVAVVLLVIAWARVTRTERAPIPWIILAVIAASLSMMLLPPSPMITAMTPLLFLLPLSVAVLRHRLFIPAEAITTAVFRSTYSGLVACDMAGRIVQINPAAARMLDTTEKEVQGQRIGQAFAPFLEKVHQESGDTPLAEVLESGIEAPVEALLRQLDPNPRALVASGQPISDEKGRQLGFVLNLRDVTESERVRQALEEQAQLVETIRELSVPIVPVMEGVLILPLVGTIDDTRAQGIMEEMLQAIGREKARAILIDITGVPVVDTMVANYLLRAVQAAQLLGCQGILVGIRADVAHTIAGLGLNLKGLATKGTLQAGLAYAVELLKSETRKPTALGGGPVADPSARGRG